MTTDEDYLDYDPSKNKRHKNNRKTTHRRRNGKLVTSRKYKVIAFLSDLGDLISRTLHIGSEKVHYTDIRMTTGIDYNKNFRVLKANSTHEQLEHYRRVGIKGIIKEYKDKMTDVKANQRKRDARLLNIMKEKGMRKTFSYVI